MALVWVSLCNIVLLWVELKLTDVGSSVVFIPASVPDSPNSSILILSNSIFVFSVS